MELSIKTSTTLLISILTCGIVISGAGISNQINKDAMSFAMQGFSAEKVSINDVVLGKSFPSITAENQRIRQYDSFQPLQYVKAMDAYDGDVSNQVQAYGKVDESIKGEYEIRYVIANSYGLKSEKKIKVLVD